MSETQSRRPARAGVIDALGLPTVVLTGGMLGFGTLCQSSGLDLFSALLATLAIWALPGQILLVDMYAAEASLWSIVIAVSVSGVRFLPMTVAVMPRMRAGLPHPALQLVVAQILSANSFLYVLASANRFDDHGRVVYYSAFASVCLSVAAAATVAGHIAASALPAAVALGFLFVNMMFLTCMLAGLREGALLASVALGLIGGPIFHHLSPDHGLIIAGALAGSLGYFLFQWRRR